VVLAEAAASSYDLLSRIAVMDSERRERSRIFRLAVFGAQSPPIMFSIEVDRSLASFWLHLSCDEETAWRDSIVRNEQVNRRATLNSMHRRLLEALVHTQEQHRRRAIFSERCSETLVVFQQFETTLRSSAIAQLHSQRLMQYEHGVALALGDHQRTRHDLFVRRLYFSHHLESWARVLAEAQRFEHSARSEVVRRMQIEYREMSSTFMFACQDIAAGVSLVAFHQLFAEEQRQRVKVTLGDTLLREARVRRDIHQQQFNDRLLLLSRRAEDSHHLGLARGFAIGLTTAYERFATEASTLSWVRHVRERALKLQDFAQDSLVKLRDSLEQSEAHSRRAIHSNRFESLRHDFELHAEPTFRQYWIDKEAQQQLQLTRLAASLAAKHEFSTLQFVEHSARNAIWNARLREVLHIYSDDYHALSVAVCVQLPHVRVLSGITQLVEATRRRELLQFATRTTARIHASANAEFEILASAQIRSDERQQRLVLRAEYFALYCAALEGFEERLRRDVLDAEEEASIELTRVHAVTDGGHACSEISQLEADVRHEFNLERTKFVLETFARHESEVRHCVQAVFLREAQALFIRAAMHTLQQVVEMEASKFQVAFEFFRRDVNFTALLDLNTSEKEIRGVVIRQWRQFWFEELESRELAVRHEKFLHAQRDLHELVVTPMMKRIRKNTVAQLQMDEFTHRQSFRAERVSGLAQLLPEMAASFTVALWGDVAHFARLAFTSNKAPLGLESIRRATIAHDEAAARVELHNAEWDILHVRGPLELVRNDESLSRIAMRKSHWLRIGDAAFRTFEAIHRDIAFKESIEAEFNIFRPHTIAVSALMRARIEHLERHGRSELRQAVLHDRVDFHEVAENLHRQVLEQQCDAERRSELCRTESKIRATVRAAEAELFDSLHSSFNVIRRQLVVDFVETKESRRRYQIKLQMRFQTLNLTETFEKQVRMTLVKEAYNWRRQHVEGLEASLRVAMVSQRVAWMQKQTRACFETSWRQEMRTENTRRTLMTSNAFLHRYLIMRAALLNESLIEYKQKFVIEFALAERTLMSKLYYEGKMLRLDWMEGKSRRSLQDVLLLGRRVPLFTSFLLTAHAAARQSLLRDYLSTSGVTLLLEEEQLERHRVGVMQRLQDFSGIFVALSMSRKNSELRSAVCDIDRVLVPQWQLWQCYVKGAKSIAHEAIELIKTRQAEAKVAMLFLQPAAAAPLQRQRRRWRRPCWERLVGPPRRRTNAWFDQACNATRAN
jgi:hypothetical protein